MKKEKIYCHCQDCKRPCKLCENVDYIFKDDYCHGCYFTLEQKIGGI